MPRLCGIAFLLYSTTVNCAKKEVFFYLCRCRRLVDAVGGAGTGCLPDFLQRVNDDQLDGRVFIQHLIQLLLQSVANQMRMGAKIQTGGSLLGQPQCADMQPPRTVLQRDVKTSFRLVSNPRKGSPRHTARQSCSASQLFPTFGEPPRKYNPGASRFSTTQGMGSIGCL